MDLKELPGLLCHANAYHFGKYALNIGPKVAMVRFLLLPDRVVVTYRPLGRLYTATCSDIPVTRANQKSLARLPIR